MNYDNYEKEGMHRMAQVARLIQKHRGVCVDIGSYKCFLKQILPKGIKYIGLDVKDWKPGVGIVCDIDKGLPLPPKVADVVVAVGVLEHSLYPQKLMEEIVRICKKDGEMIISTPNNGSPIIKIKKLFLKIAPVEEQRFGHHWEFNRETGMVFVGKYLKIIKNVNYFSHRLWFLDKLKLKGEQFFYCRKLKELKK